MDKQQAVEDLEALRVAVGRHMMALDSMTPVEQSNAYLCDLERMRQITRKMDELER